MGIGITEKIRRLFRSSEYVPKCSAVILAAGNSTRMGEDKIEMTTGGVPVIVRAVRAFEESDDIDEIILVTREDRVAEIAELVSGYGFSKLKSVISGGNTRVESSLAGVLAVRHSAELIAIHDCARPFVTGKIIHDAVTTAYRYYAACPVIPCTDTMKIMENGFLGGTVDRESLCRIQTPQIFNADLIKGALTYAVKNSLPVTDDTSAMEYLGYRTRIVDGDAENIKLTTPDDLIFADAIVGKRGE